MAASGMDPGTLVEAAVTLLKTYRPAVDTVDSHVRSALGAYDEVRGAGALRAGDVLFGRWPGACLVLANRSLACS